MLLMEGGKKFWQNREYILGLVIGLIIVFVITLFLLLASNLLKNIKTPINSANQPNVDQNLTDNTEAVGPETESITNPAINTFELKRAAEICKEGGKPVIYLFTVASCPHCTWIKATFDKVAMEYEKAGKIKAYHYDLETGDDLLTLAVETQVPASALATYFEFNPNDSIPTFVFGCQYFRIGNGYENEDSLANEEKEFRAVIEAVIK